MYIKIILEKNINFKKMNRYVFKIVSTIIIISSIASSQTFNITENKLELKDFHYISNIGYSQIKNPLNEYFDPHIKLNSSDQLVFSFDILNESYNGNYAYTFIHCNSNWTISNLNQSEYLNGFTDNYIDNYLYSFNTTTEYINYEILFPNENVNFSKSGNYIILIYDVEKNIPLITKRFVVYEQIVNIETHIKKPSILMNMKSKHEINFIINDYKKLNIIDFSNDINVVIKQNNDWSKTMQNCYPSFIHPQYMEFNNYDEFLFLAGSEFRDFDIKNLEYLGNHIKQHQLLSTKTLQNKPSLNLLSLENDNYHHITLYTDQKKDTNNYLFSYDLNGKYVLANENHKDMRSEGEYALVNFSLKHEKLISKEIYVYGELTNWNKLQKNKMIYNQETKQYECSIYLKQGYYNYKYIITDSTQNIIHNHIESNFYETRNKYTIYIYHTPLWQNYDRIIGISQGTSNSLN